MEELEIKLKEAGKISRLTDKTFHLDERIGEGFWSANYFLKTRKIVAEQAPGHIVEEQFFQRRDNTMVCGIDECIAILHKFAFHPENLEIFALHDGDIVSAGEPVLKIYGKYEDFGFLESILDGVLARRSSVATNVKDVVTALRGTDCFSMYCCLWLLYCLHLHRMLINRLFRKKPKRLKRLPRSLRKLIPVIRFGLSPE